MSFGEHMHAFLLFLFCLAVRDAVEMSICDCLAHFVNISIKYILRIAGSNGMNNYILSRFGRTVL